LIRMTKHNFLMIIAAALLIILSGEHAAGNENRLSHKKRITVTDLAGRKVSVQIPAEKIILSFDRHLPTFSAIAGHDFLEKIVGWGKITPISDQNIYREFKKKYPEIMSIPDIGTHAKGTFSVEKVMALKPDLILYPLWAVLDKYEGITDDLDRLEQAGIPTVIIDYWKDPFENSITSTLLIGSMLGKEERAGEIAAFYKDRVGKVINRLANIKKNKPKVYLEGASKEPSQYGWSCGNAGWGVILKKAGAVNIAEGIIKERGTIAPEYLLKTNPDIIIVSSFGGFWQQPDDEMKTVLPEYDKKPMLDFLKAITERPGWGHLDAVKNGKIYGIFDSSYYIYNNIYTFAVVQAIAKWLYPDEFKDLDPGADLHLFEQRFMPVYHNDLQMIEINR